MDFPYGLHSLLVMNVNIPISRANIWIVCAINVSPLIYWNTISENLPYSLQLIEAAMKMTNMMEYGYIKSRFHQCGVDIQLVKLILSKANFLMMWTMWFLEHNV